MEENRRIDVRIGERIKKRRLEMGMTQKELATKLGMTDRSTIAKWESGMKPFRQTQIVTFAKILKTTPEYLLGMVFKPDEKVGTPGADKIFDTDMLQILYEWEEIVGCVIPTQKEIEEILNYAKFIISQRKEK